MTPELYIDSRPTKASWTRDGNIVGARLDPIDGPGPWLVRVVASDAQHKELGRYMLDVDGRQPLTPVKVASKRH